MLSQPRQNLAILKSNFAYAVIFEDDVSFDSAHLKNTISELIINKKEWDICTLDTVCDTVVPIKKLDDNQQLVIYLGRPCLSSAYLVNRKAARNLIKKALPIKMPLDHYFFRGWELDVKFTGVFPSPIHQTFGNSEMGSIFPTLAGNPINKFLYKTSSVILNFTHLTKEFLKSTY